MCEMVALQSMHLPDQKIAAFGEKKMQPHCVTLHLKAHLHIKAS